MDMNNRFQIFVWSLHHNFGIIPKVWMIVLFIYWIKYASRIWDHFKSMCHYIVFGNMHHKFEIPFKTPMIDLNFFHNVHKIIMIFLNICAIDLKYFGKYMSLIFYFWEVCVKSLFFLFNALNFVFIVSYVMLVCFFGIVWKWTIMFFVLGFIMVFSFFLLCIV
jgi:hypothetical protein